MSRSLFLVLAISLLMPLPVPAAEPGVIAVIVSPGHSARLNADDLALIFSRKKLYWANGKKIHPVNLSSDNPLRRDFSQAMLGNMPEAQAEYWNGLYYHGISPPHVVNSQEAMLRFVAETRGAIGYVNACMVDSRVKALLWIDQAGEVLTIQPTLRCEL